MDTRDVSHEGVFAAMLQRLEIMHKVSQIKNGQLVHDHPSPKSIVARFFAAKRRMDSPAASAADSTFATTQLPPPYPPSDRFLDELQPMRIQQMRLGEHHRGAKVIVRVLTPANRMNAVMAVIEDLAGTDVLLQLYHQPPDDTFPSEEILQVGNVLIIKEPFFKCATDGSYSLRVDHLSDVVWLMPSDSRIPDVWSRAIPEMKSEDLRMQGNEAVKKKHWAKALRLYSNAAQCAATPEEAQLAFVNRSFVNLKLNRPEQAFLDATKTNDRIPPTEKALFRGNTSSLRASFF